MLMPLYDPPWTAQLATALWPYYAFVAFGLAVLGIRKCWGG
ncbi:hypothetical protein [Azospirillum aestuarii]